MYFVLKTVMLYNISHIYPLALFFQETEEWKKRPIPPICRNIHASELHKNVTLH